MIRAKEADRKRQRERERERGREEEKQSYLSDIGQLIKVDDTFKLKGHEESSIFTAVVQNPGHCERNALVLIQKARQ